MSEPEIREQATESRVKITKIDAVRQFVQMMKDNELTALDFIDGRTQIRLRRRGNEVLSAPGSVASAVYAPPPAQPASPAAATPAAPTPTPVAVTVGLVIESPMVGTYYSSNSPEAASFVSVGSTVRADTTVCIIEAMKVFTDIPAGSIIPAGSSGTITEVLVKNGQAVEYGQPLFRVKLG